MLNYLGVILEIDDFVVVEDVVFLSKVIVWFLRINIECVVVFLFFGNIKCF